MIRRCHSLKKEDFLNINYHSTEVREMISCAARINALSPNIINVGKTSRTAGVVVLTRCNGICGLIRSLAPDICASTGRKMQDEWRGVALSPASPWSFSRHGRSVELVSSRWVILSCCLGSCRVQAPVCDH